MRAGCWVWGNEEQLRQLVQNLIVNAVFYTPRGGLVRVDLHGEGDCVLTSVCDTGPGIREEDFDKLFTRYYKAQGNDRKGATGLGLSIALGLAELHKGTIEVLSRVGEGSAFTVRLPLLEG